MEAFQGTTADGVLLRGELQQGSTSTWLVLIHDDGGDLDGWRPLLDELGRSGWGLLALDLRGHGGSEGRCDRDRYSLDVDLGVRFARSLGAEHVAIVAAGLGAVASLECVAAALDAQTAAVPDSLVLLSPGPLAGCDLRRLRGEGLAKLLISGAFGPQAADARAILRTSIGWTVSVTFATDTSGSELLAGFAAHIADRIGTFVREQAALGGPHHERRIPGLPPRR